MAAKQPGLLFFFFFFDYHYTTTWLAQLHLTALKVCGSLSFPVQLFTSSLLLVLSSLYLSESLRSCLLNQNGCVCRGREKEGMRGRQRDAGESERWGGGGYRAEMSCSDVTSAVSRQDAAMCHTHERRGRMGRKLNVWQGKKKFLSKRSFICASCSVFKTWKPGGCAEVEGDGGAQIETELCWKQKKVWGQMQSCLKASVQYLCATCKCVWVRDCCVNIACKP